MLLTHAPMPVNLVRFSPTSPQAVNVRVNKEIYQQQVLMHQNIIYALAANGFIVVITITASM
jgi:16S rRNA C1402 N4-methylase RsmH